MGHNNSTFERTPRSGKLAKPPGDFDASRDAKRVRERKEPTFQRNDKRQQWQDSVEF